MQFLIDVTFRFLGLRRQAPTWTVGERVRATTGSAPLSNAHIGKAPESARPLPDGDLSRTPLWLMKSEMVGVIRDCPEDRRDKLTLAIYRSVDAIDLWLLRTELFQSISQHHGQHEARRRINELLPFFVDWLPRRQLVAI